MNMENNVNETVQAQVNVQNIPSEPVNTTETPAPVQPQPVQGQPVPAAQPVQGQPAPMYQQPVAQPYPGQPMPMPQGQPIPMAQPAPMYQQPMGQPYPGQPVPMPQGQPMPMYQQPMGQPVPPQPTVNIEELKAQEAARKLEKKRNRAPGWKILLIVLLSLANAAGLGIVAISIIVRIFLG